MTQAIQLLLIQIMQLGALLAADPRYTVFTTTHGHVCLIKVEIYPAGSIWEDGIPTPEPIAEAQTRWKPHRSPQDEEAVYANALQHTQSNLEFMRAALHAYLPAADTAKYNQQEAA